MRTPPCTFTYPLTTGVVGAPQMTSQPVYSICLCSPLPSWTWRTPGLSISFGVWCKDFPDEAKSTLVAEGFDSAVNLSSVSAKDIDALKLKGDHVVIVKAAVRRFQEEHGGGPLVTNTVSPPCESPRAHLHAVGMLRFMSDINQPSLPAPFYSVLLSVFVFITLSTVFHSTNSPDNSPFSHSVIPVLSLPYWSFQIYISL